MVLQKKGSDHPQAVKPSRPVPVAPPVYRPHPTPKVLQRKVACVHPLPATRTAQSPNNTHPVAPPVYRAQPVPRVLQTKKVESKAPSAKPKALTHVTVPLVRKQHTGSVIQRAAVLGGGAVYCSDCGVANPRGRQMCWSCMQPLELDEAVPDFPDAKPLPRASYVPVRLPEEEMSDKDYEDYVASSKKWMENRAAKPVAKLKVGSHLYHGTSEDVAKIVAVKGLQPASPEFRAVPKKGKGKRWDASRDGFLSMATGKGGVTITAKSVILRMMIQAGDLETWEWKAVGGADEVVSTLSIPPDRLEWSKNGKDWYPMSQFS